MAPARLCEQASTYRPRTAMPGVLRGRSGAHRTLMALCVAFVFGATASATAQDVVRALPWEGWYGPFADGAFGLRFGMDRATVARIADEHAWKVLASRDRTLRYEARVAGLKGEVLLLFLDDGGADGRLREIRVSWTLDGLPQRPWRLYQRLVELLEKRYGEAVAVQEEDGRQSLDTGRGIFRRLYYGEETKALVELRAVRPEHFLLVYRLENPQLEPESDD